MENITIEQALKRKKTVFIVNKEDIEKFLNECENHNLRWNSGRKATNPVETTKITIFSVFKQIGLIIRYSEAYEEHRLMYDRDIESLENPVKYKAQRKKINK